MDFLLWEVKEKMERETGLEPATLSLEGWRSSQLSYSRDIIKLWWWEKDSNLRRQKPADLQSALVGHLSISPNKKVFKTVELDMGLEPATCWLQISCSTNWANPAPLLNLMTELYTLFLSLSRVFFKFLNKLKKRCSFYTFLF